MSEIASAAVKSAATDESTDEESNDSDECACEELPDGQPCFDCYCEGATFEGDAQMALEHPSPACGDIGEGTDGFCEDPTHGEDCDCGADPDAWEKY